MASSLLSANPGNVFVVAYHPSNSSYTSGDPMVRTYPAAFYTTPFVGNSRYMPSAMIARRIWGAERIQGTGSWAADVNVIKGESSPLNVGVSSTYNSSNTTLTVNIEVYFTGNVTNSLTLYAMLIENGIVAYQNGGGNNYVHLHAFREAIASSTPAQWGETISAPTTQGTLKTFTFTFNNAIPNYVMANCELVVFVRDAVSGEIISGNGAPIGSSSPVGIDNNTVANENYSIYPNPLVDNATISFNLTNSENISYQIYDVLGQMIDFKDLGVLATGNHQIDLNTSNLKKGVYFVNIGNGNQNKTIKVIK